MDKAERVATRINNDTDGNIPDIAAILREAFPQAEASEELARIIFNSDGEEIGREMAGLILGRLRSDFLGIRDYLARPAPAPEKALREAYQQGLANMSANFHDFIADAFESGYMQGHNDTVESCFRDSKEAATEYIEFDLPKALLAHEAPKEWA